MYNILLVCAAGMSTSMLVKKMERAADNQKLEVKIQAIPEAEVTKHSNEADIILLGPQVRFMKDKIQEKAGVTPVEVIDMASYGTMNGEKVLKSAIERIEG